MLTYFTFLLFFIGFPMLFQSIFYIKRYLNAEEFQKNRFRKVFTAIISLIVIAVIYTTPWDNYLVQNEIWYYQSTKVLGITFGYVPIEEYAFFIIQTIFSGLLLGWFLIEGKKTLSDINNENLSNSKMRIISTGMLLVIWLLSFLTYISDINSLLYLNLILLWAIPPIAIQLLYGADILWESRRSLVLIIISSTIYLAAIDAIAISSGIWTISINTSTGILLGGILPIEELIFFLVTNILITFGLALIVDFRSNYRFKMLISKLKATTFQF